MLNLDTTDSCRRPGRMHGSNGVWQLVGLSSFCCAPTYWDWPVSVAIVYSRIRHRAFVRGNHQFSQLDPSSSYDRYLSLRSSFCRRRAKSDRLLGETTSARLRWCVEVIVPYTAQAHSNGGKCGRIGGLRAHCQYPSGQQGMDYQGLALVRYL
jgi:hypothetical protein